MKLCFATKQEKSNPFPGDSIVDCPEISSTHAITINVDREKVWPWIVQIGQDRGGFYSYAMLENLLGCKMTNADKIHHQWQKLDVGDTVQLHPKFPPMLVDAIEIENHIVLIQQNRLLWSWAFVLVAADSSQTRLLVRTRISADRWWLKAILYPIMTVGHYVMERRMLIGIKNRSESSNQ